MSTELAMQNFTQNTLQGVGQGASIGASNGSQELGLLKDLDTSFSSLQKKIGSQDIFSQVLGKAFEGMQGAASTVSLSGLFSGFNPPATPISSSAKIPGILSSKGR